MLTKITKNKLRNNVFKSLKCFEDLKNKKDELAEKIRSYAIITLTDKEREFYDACIKDFKRIGQMALILQNNINLIFYPTAQNLEELRKRGLNVATRFAYDTEYSAFNGISTIEFKNEERLPKFMCSISVNELDCLKARVPEEIYQDIINTLNEYYELYDLNTEIAKRLENIINMDFLTSQKLEQLFPDFYKKYLKND